MFVVTATSALQQSPNAHNSSCWSYHHTVPTPPTLTLPYPHDTISELNPATYITPGKSSSHYKNKGQFSFTFSFFFKFCLYHSKKNTFHNMVVTDFPCVCSPWPATEKIIQKVHFGYLFCSLRAFAFYSLKLTSKHKVRCVIFNGAVLWLLKDLIKEKQPLSDKHKGQTNFNDVQY